MRHLIDNFISFSSSICLWSTFEFMIFILVSSLAPVRLRTDTLSSQAVCSENCLQLMNLFCNSWELFIFEQHHMTTVGANGWQKRELDRRQPLAGVTASDPQEHPVSNARACQRSEYLPPPHFHHPTSTFFKFQPKHWVNRVRGPSDTQGAVLLLSPRPMNRPENPWESWNNSQVGNGWGWRMGVRRAQSVFFYCSQNIHR